jgi:hypothetical protein
VRRQVLMAAQQALEVLMVVMPPLHCADILAHKLPSDAAVASGTAVDGEVLCATVRCLQVRYNAVWHWRMQRRKTTLVI